jgi:hypothetical protein
MHNVLTNVNALPYLSIVIVKCQDGCCDVESAARESSMSKQNWTALIDDMVAGRWTNPLTGKLAQVPYEAIVIEESLDGREAELVAALKLGHRLAVVADQTTYEAMGARVAKALRGLGPVETVVLDHPHADMAEIRTLTEKLRGFDAVVAVGSGTVNDLCKYVTGLDGRRYCVFATAASMNGYTSSTASITRRPGFLSISRSPPQHHPISPRPVLPIALPARWRRSTGGCRTGYWERHISRSLTPYRLSTRSNSTSAPATCRKVTSRRSGISIAC